MYSSQQSISPFLSNSLFFIIFKFLIMKYIKPYIKVEEAQAVQMLAESLTINNGTTVDGSQALTKETDDWDIWGAE